MLIANLRREYSLTGLYRHDLDADPIVQFKAWFDQAAGARRSGRVRSFLICLYKVFSGMGVSQATEANAATLATVGGDRIPSARIVLLKGVDERGFIFFTNYESRKGHELTANPHAALVFYWANQERQVRISGTVQKIPHAESEAYFKTRPRASRLGAWASQQSEPVESRSTLEERWKELEAKFPGEEIPMPPHWGGYVLAPARIEFWQGRPGRLHDRFEYQKQIDGSWSIERLCP